MSETRTIQGTSIETRWVPPADWEIRLGWTMGTLYVRWKGYGITRRAYSEQDAIRWLYSLDGWLYARQRLVGIEKSMSAISSYVEKYGTELE